MREEHVVDAEIRKHSPVQYLKKAEKHPLAPRHRSAQRCGSAVDCFKTPSPSALTTPLAVK